VAVVLAADPIAAVDVGAARGVPPHWRPFLDHLRVEAFEPNAEECARLAASSDPHITWNPVALAGEVGPRDLHVLATPTGSSFFPPDPDFVRLFGVEGYSEVDRVASLDCTTLQAHLDDRELPGPHLLKLDTQGSELEILQGLSADRWPDVLAVEVEAEVHPAYAGQPLFGDVHAFLQGQGLHLLDIGVQRVHLTGGVTEQHYLRRHLDTAVGTPQLTAQIHAVDGIYIRPLTVVAESDDPVLLARYLTILQAYRYFDGMFWLLDQPAVRALAPGGADALVAEYVSAAPRRRWRDGSGRLPWAWRRARRVSSHVAERYLGADGFDPPRTFWTHTYWPDR
jgi:FkbM family methyltransferase